ncbi:MAG: tetratricopeptide repeat protein, partial [Anaerolineae bacterium]|nr:tetratricopeptide repeat protein [Anaerolineae bacterium]
NPPPLAVDTLARWLMEAGDPAAAHELLSRLIASQEADVGVLIAYAEASREVGQLDQALEALDAAQMAAADDHQAHYAIGWVYISLEKFSLAEMAFQRAIELNPSHAWSYIGLAESYIQANIKMDQVPIILGMAREHAGQDAGVLVNAGWLLQDIGECEQALINFEQALEMEPGLVEAQEGIDSCR